MMSDAVLFAVVLVGFFIARGVFATVIFFFMLGDDDRCPNCDAETLYVQSRGWNTLLPWFRTSWCPECGWEGMLRRNRRRPRSVGAALPRTSAQHRTGSG